MLIGAYLHKMDAKRRLPLPARLRQELGVTVVITRGLEGCLFVYPLVIWQGVAEKLMNAPQGAQASRGFTRLLLSSAHEVELDALGRVLIPDSLSEYAGLQKEVLVVGVGNRLEIWSKARWNEYRERIEKNDSAMAEKLGELGLY